MVFSWISDDWHVFESIRNEYGMEPLLEHYGCMVDILGFAGLLNEACKFVERMSINLALPLVDVTWLHL